jgi:hypothetical protein
VKLPRPTRLFADEVIQFFKLLEYKGSLPEGISIMNPFRDNPGIFLVISQFYHKFYNDNNPRHLILGINPGRFGAGVTGIPFTTVKDFLINVDCQFLKWIHSKHLLCMFMK